MIRILSEETKNPEKRFDAFEALIEANSGKEDFPVELGYIDEAADGKGDLLRRMSEAGQPDRHPQRMRGGSSMNEYKEKILRLVEANLAKDDGEFKLVSGVDKTAVVRIEQLGCRTRNYAKVDPQTALDDLKNRSEIPALYESETLLRLLSD